MIHCYLGLAGVDVYAPDGVHMGVAALQGRGARTAGEGVQEGVKEEMK